MKLLTTKIPKYSLFLFIFGLTNTCQPNKKFLIFITDLLLDQYTWIQLTIIWLVYVYKSNYTMQVCIISQVIVNSYCLPVCALLLISFYNYELNFPTNNLFEIVCRHFIFIAFVLRNKIRNFYRNTFKSHTITHCVFEYL